MSYKRLFVFVEGKDDKHFIDKVILPLLNEKYHNILVYEYAQKKDKQIRNFIKSINSMNAHYIFLTDINDSPCVTFKKDRITEKFDLIDKDNIIVVVKEIESWYMAGQKEKDLLNMGIKKTPDRNMITKEKFNDLIPNRFSRIDFMQEILKYFDIDSASGNNTSFDYFKRKYLI